MFYSFMHLWSGLALLAIDVYVLRDESARAGLVGWVYTDEFDRLPLQLTIFVICDVIGLCGYVLVMKYFDPLMISLVMLTEPLVGTGEGILMGVADFPGTWSLVGAGVMLCGIGFVSHGAKKSSTTIDAAAALSHPTDDVEAQNDIDNPVKYLIAEEC
eukprot:TRINITY_DN470_c0_g2_i6.p2 TRINITY_DN470_c0_g2~~TRINITY_DN470_c0_g2_i6.p2  ORF type:complete len:158 (-),score=25.90 TRINITY_DN470_c0_g2_i6:284-757(-)